ncbi:MAG: outer membrane lipoprotein carrier protein LolA [candidate division NC10 bacterium]|nr:outer membrane lipoprotein carrier protein LolA [candidate division NC10 bacterium]
MRTPVALLLAAGLLLPAAAPPAATDVVGRIEARYQALSTLQGRYLQTATLQVAGQTERAAGKFFLKRPAMMRWEQESPEPRLLVTDGTTLWTYSPLDRQAITQPVGPALQASPSLHFLTGMATLGATFTGGPPHRRGRVREHHGPGVQRPPGEPPPPGQPLLIQTAAGDGRDPPSFPLGGPQGAGRGGQKLSVCLPARPLDAGRHL